MIRKEDIAAAIDSYLHSNELFLVNITVSPQNDIEVYVDTLKGEITIDNCSAINDIIEAAFNREKEDYSLMVSSAGLDMPLMVPQQYEKFMGCQVQITLTKGGWLKGTLTGYGENGIELTTVKMEKEEGAKKKVAKSVATLYRLSEVKSCKPVVEFK